MQAPLSMMERILHLMAEKNASDVYLSAHAPASIRINGVCHNINNQPLPAEAPLELLSEIVPERRIEELRETSELNMAIPLSGIGNYRISAMRQRGSYAAVIRYISPVIPKLDELNLPGVLERLVMEPRGLILMVGATGSGKSTTLASMLDHRNERVSGHILTIENPIEYMFDNKKSVINQREVGTDTATLQVALMNALRQAPDVIMIGEIRDRETMTAAVTYAQSGHLCLATLHANNSYQALNRILSFYPIEVRPTLLGDLSAALKAIVSLRLLPMIGGGRIPAVEVLLNTTLISDLIEQGDFGGVKEAMVNAMAEGSMTFEDELARLVYEQKIDRETALAFADSPTNLLWQMQNRGLRQLGKKTQDEEHASDEATFTELVIDVQPSTFARSEFGTSGFDTAGLGPSGFGPSTDFSQSGLGGASDSRVGGS